MPMIKKLALLVISLAVVLALSGCEQPRAGQPCSIPDKISQDANGLKLKCVANASDELVWLIVGKG